MYWKTSLPVLTFLVVLMLMSWGLGIVPIRAADFLNDENYEEQAVKNIQVPDPLERWNRAVFAVNDRIYLWMLEPVATGYSKVLPADIRNCVGNFFYNIGEPMRSINSLLQGRVRDSGVLFGRFAVNSVLGIFGLADAAASEFNMKRIHTDFGQTLAAWGVGDGLYLVVPVLGPSTLRDVTGIVTDNRLFMRSYSPWNDDLLTSAALYGTDMMNRTSLHLGEYQQLKSITFDSYLAFRNGYFQMRNKQRERPMINK